MTWENVAAFSALAALLTITPGVDFALVTRSAISSGQRAALLTTWGIVSGLMVWAFASAVGVAALLAASATAYDVLRLLGAAYLIWLGIQGLRARHAAQPPPAGRSHYLTGLLNNITNPKIVVFYSTVLPGFIPDGASVLQWSLILASIHAAMGLVWLTAYSVVLGRMRDVLERPAVRRTLDRVSGAVLIGLGARLALERR